MADQQRAREALEQRRREIALGKVEAYRQLIGMPVWRTCYLDLMHFASTAPNDARSAGRYDVLARILTAAEGVEVPNVVTTERADG